MEDLPPVRPPRGIRKSSSKSSLDREESWRRKPVKKRKKTLDELVPGGAEASNPFTTSVGRHSLYNSSNKGATTSSSKAATSNSKAEKNLDNPKASQSHRRSKSAASLLSSKLQVYRLVFLLKFHYFDVGSRYIKVNRTPHITLTFWFKFTKN